MNVPMSHLLGIFALLPVLGVMGTGSRPDCSNMPFKNNDFEDDGSAPPRVLVNTSAVRK